MADALGLASDVVTGGTALGGLFLVYIGSLTASYSSFQKTEQTPIRGRFQTKAWLAVVGLVFALVSAALAVLGKWLSNECLASASAIGLIISLAWGCFAAVISAREIR